MFNEVLQPVDATLNVDETIGLITDGNSMNPKQKRPLSPITDNIGDFDFYPTLRLVAS